MTLLLLLGIACTPGTKDAASIQDTQEDPAHTSRGDTSGTDDSDPDDSDPDDSASEDTAETDSASGDTGDSVESGDASDTGEEVSGPYTGVQRLENGLAAFDGSGSEDMFGWDVGVVGDVNGDGCAGLLIGAYEADPAGLAYLVCTPIGAPEDITAAATAIFSGIDAEDDAGLNVAGNVDWSGDGLPDVAITAPYAAGGFGAVYLLSGPFVGAVSLNTARLTVVGAYATEGAGEDLTMVGDVTGDGSPDLALGGNEASARPPYAGVVSILSLGSGRTGTVSADDLDARIVGDGYAEWAGSTIANAGDMDGDGIADLAIGGAGVGGSAHEGGVSWIIPGPISGVQNISDGSVVIDGDGYSGGYNAYTKEVGDLDGDGYRDIGIGLGWQNAWQGVVYVIHGPPGDVLDVLDAPTRFVAGPGTAQNALYVSLEPGDVNGDGIPDVAFGAPTTFGERYDATGTVVGSAMAAGALITVFGPFVRGVYDLDDADVLWRGEQENGHAGEPLAAAGDVDHDGCADILVGSWPYYDHQGHAWLVGGCR